MRLRDLEGKRVALWGAGRETGATLRAARRLNITFDAHVIDEGSGPDTFEGLAVSRGPKALTQLRDFDIVVKSPGISRYRPELTAIADAGGVVTSATRLWFGEGLRAIAVTGTKGKSTTSSLIAHLLNASGWKAQLAGNIGRSPIDYLGDVDPDIWVLELSSFQTADLDRSPEVGVLTTLSPEHLDWHEGEDNYFADKLNLFAHDPSIKSVVNMADQGARRAGASLPNVVPANSETTVHVVSGWFMNGDTRLFETSNLGLAGIHNLQLACVALTAVSALGVDLAESGELLSKALSTFESLPHRLARVGERNGVSYIDDGLATTPIATMAALDAFRDRPVTVLLGGHDRGVDYSPLGKHIAGLSNLIRVLTMPANGERIAAAIKQFDPHAPVSAVDSLEEAVKVASEVTPEGGAVLLSPAAASFGAFRDYVERSEAFVKLVEDLSERIPQRDG